MFESLQSLSASFAALLIGAAVGMAWMAAITAPNCSYDRLDASRADGHVRELLKRASSPAAALLLAATAFSMLSGAIGATTLSALSAIGLFSNRWTLAPAKSRKVAPGVRSRTSRKGQRVVAVSLTLMFTAVAAVAGVLAIFRV